MKTEIRLITPTIAENMLQKNDMNTRIRVPIVNEYARQMTMGIWEEDTGDPIRFASDGSLLDGQHRLLALIKAKVSLSFLIITDLEKTIFPVLGTGYKRTMGDVLYIAGNSHSTAIAAGIKRYFNLKRNVIISYDIRGISTIEILNIYKSKPEFWNSSVLLARSWYDKSQSILHTADFLGYYAFFYDINTKDAFIFMNSLSQGVDLSSTNPIKLLRDKLIFSKINTKFAMRQSQQVSLMFKTWNYFRKKESIKLLRFNQKLDNFPKPI
jgi:hypothetical protein